MRPRNLGFAKSVWTKEQKTGTTSVVRENVPGSPVCGGWDTYRDTFFLEGRHRSGV